VLWSVFLNWLWADKTYVGDGESLSSEEGYPLFLLTSVEDGMAGGSSNIRMSSTSALQDGECRLVLRLVRVRIPVKGLVHW
jgi:hypothetical protein